MRVSVAGIVAAVAPRSHRMSPARAGGNRALIGAALGVSALTNASAAVSTFDSGPEGWSASFGAAAWSASGGAPGGVSGGFLRIEAPIAGPSGRASAAAAFLGEQAKMLGSTLSFDVLVLQGPLALDPTPGTAWSVSVTIVNASMKQGVATRVFTDAAGLEAPWASLAAPLTGEAWGVSDKKLARILAGVTDVSVEVLANEIPAPFAYGIDNFGFIPTPGAAALLVIAGLVSAVRRRR